MLETEKEGKNGENSLSIYWLNDNNLGSGKEKREMN